MIRMKLALIAALMLIPLAVRADSNQLVDKIQMGEHWTGVEIGKDDLRGKVVVIEIWGFS